ncbi:hypothetical protein PR048_005869 [Dryococelus australis]|uniref:Cytochrome P450 n=1 Tax=Dryococelus australis TaxID=614101 RepID=A0ABQ9I9E4_9NEOP|nr:hypothetical protein PR048_005869 [Dryococelus australis]
MADRLKQHCDKCPFNVLEYTMMCTLDMVTETSLNVTMDIQKQNKQHCAIENILKIVEIGSVVILRPWFWFTLNLKFTTLYRDILDLVNPVRYFVDNIVINKTESYLNSRQIFQNHKSNAVGANMSKQYLGFLDHMISTMVKSPGLFTAEELRDHAMFVMAAATDTSGYTRKVMKEQSNLFGKDMRRPVTIGDLKQMVYLEQVINEKMRLYPVVPIIGRRVDEDIRVNGYTLPAGTSLLIPIYLVHRNPAYFLNPDKFYPERFNGRDIGSRPVCSFIPFTSGPRICIGKYYAYMAMKTVLSVLLRRYEVLEYGSTNDVECVKYQVILTLVNGYNIKMAPRKKGNNSYD